MIICASRRTDIPAFHSEWMMNRLRAGYVLVRNPVCRTVINRVDLRRSNVDCMIFMTKDPRPMIPHLDELDSMGLRYCFQVTITPYGKDIEPGVGFKADIADAFKTLSSRIGKERIIWRYDPVILGGKMDAEYHRKKFKLLCRELEGYTDRCTFSFLDMYGKISGSGLRTASGEEKDAIGEIMSKTASEHGIELSYCCADRDLSKYGIIPRGCIDGAAMARMGSPFEEAASPLRPGCRCVKNIDIGAYDTCLHDCVYCYANGKSSKRRHSASYNPESEILGDPAAEGDEVLELKSRDVLRLSDF